MHAFCKPWLSLGAAISQEGTFWLCKHFTLRPLTTAVYTEHSISVNNCLLVHRVDGYLDLYQWQTGLFCELGGKKPTTKESKSGWKRTFKTQKNSPAGLSGLISAAVTALDVFLWMDGSIYLGACRIIATKVNVQSLERDFLIAGRNSRVPSTEDMKSKKK